MTKLIIYINSEQNASAYRIEEDNSYSISFNGNEYESDLSTFAEIVMDELRATPLSKMESRGGISVLLVSNGAANETIRKIMELLFHDDNEDGMLNVNIQELNVIEANYFLPLIGKPESPSAKDFIQFFDIADIVVADSKEIQELETKVSELSKSIELKDKELQVLSQFKEDVTKAIEKKLEGKKLLEKKRMQDCIHKIDFIHDSQWNDILAFLPHSSEKVHFYRKMKNGDEVFCGQIIGEYCKTSRTSTIMLPMPSGRNVIAKTNGVIYFLADDNKIVGHGEIVAVIGDFNSLEEARDFVNYNS